MSKYKRFDDSEHKRSIDEKDNENENDNQNDPYQKTNTQQYIHEHQEIPTNTDPDSYNEVISKALEDTKYMASRQGFFWLPTLDKVVYNVFGAVWKNNKYVQKEVEHLMNEPSWFKNIRAFVAIYSATLIWIACWNILTVNYHTKYNNIIYFNSYRKYIDLGYLFIGTCIMLFNGTLYQTAGYVGTWRKPEYYKSFLYIKVLSSLLGQFLFCIGCWDIVGLAFYDTSDWSNNVVYDNDNTSTPNPYYIIKLIALYWVGMFFIYISDTYWTLSCVIPPWYKPIKLIGDLSYLTHFKYTFLSILSLFGANSTYACLYNFGEYYSDSDIWRELFYMSIGLLIFICSGSFVSNSFIWQGFNDRYNEGKNDHESPPLIIFLVYSFRGFLSLNAQIIHNAGAWTFFDEYILTSKHRMFYRDLGYLFIGIIGLAWSKALLLNASITPFSIPIQPDGLAITYNTIKPHHIDNNKNDNNRLPKSLTNIIHRKVSNCSTVS